MLFAFDGEHPSCLIRWSVERNKRVSGEGAACQFTVVGTTDLALRGGWFALVMLDLM